MESVKCFRDHSGYRIHSSSASARVRRPATDGRSNFVDLYALREYPSWAVFFVFLSLESLDTERVANFPWNCFSRSGIGPSKTIVVERYFAYGDLWIGRSSVGRRRTTSRPFPLVKREVGVQLCVNTRPKSRGIRCSSAVGRRSLVVSVGAAREDLRTL